LNSQRKINKNYYFIKQIKMKNTIADTYLEHELEKALMEDRDRDMLFQLENEILGLVNNEGI
jgi:hypothetical protein